MKLDREAFREAALKCVGGTWPDGPALDARVLEVLDRGDHVAERVYYQAERGEYIGAWVLRPKGNESADSADRKVTPKKPAIAVWHQHNNEYQIGKSESAGFIGNPMHHTGLKFVRAGYVVLCPDALGFEERRSEKLAGADYERYLFCKYLSEGKSLAWKNILDCRRALDYLCSRPEIDTDRIGCYGHSLGSTFSWLLAPWEERLRCVAGNCCMPSYQAIFDAPLNHSFSNYIPSLRRYGDIPDWVSLIAPTPLHLNFGAADVLNPIEAVRRELPLIADAYAAQKTENTEGAETSFSWYIDENAGHELNDRMLSEIMSFFGRYLGDAQN